MIDEKTVSRAIVLVRVMMVLVLMVVLHVLVLVKLRKTMQKKKKTRMDDVIQYEHMQVRGHPVRTHAGRGYVRSKT